jgi:O-antigen biosynthesis protein
VSSVRFEYVTISAMEQPVEPVDTLSSDIAKVKELWGSSQNTWRTSNIVHWTQLNSVQERMNLLTSGTVKKDRFQYFIDTYLRRLPVKRALTLGCGHGDLERGLTKYNFAVQHDGIDIAEGAIAEAKRLASEAGLKNLRYTVADLNTVELPRYEYDVVFGIGSVHHIAALEHLLIQVSQWLKPNGYLFLDEYIGPNQFQWPDSQLSIINEQIELMPERFKRAVIQPTWLKGPMKRHTIQEMNAVDPSEAIRSDDIIPLVSTLFDVSEVKGYGGSLLHLLLEHIAGNFDDSNPEAVEYLRWLFALEDELIDSGKLQHDFALIIAKKKTRWRTWVRYSGHRIGKKLANLV